MVKSKINKQTNKQTKQTKNIKKKEYTEYVVRNKDKYYKVACEKTSVACIASVSARVHAQKLEREQTNKRKGRGSGSKFSRHKQRLAFNFSFTCVRDVSLKYKW